MSESLASQAGRYLLRSGMALALLEAAARLKSPHPHEQAATRFILHLARQAYGGSGRRVVWLSAFVPAELIWALDLVPFYPEIASAIGAGRGLGESAVARAGEAGYPVDLCTFHRNIVGLTLEGYLPEGVAYVATSVLCDVAGQVMANMARRAGRPFVLLDVPATADEESVAYVEGQLADLVRQLEESANVTLDPERLRQAIRLSNAARECALEVEVLRTARPGPLRGSAMLGQVTLIVNAMGTAKGLDYYKALLEYTRTLVERREGEQKRQRVYLYWMHLRPYYPFELLTNLEDELGAVIAFEEYSALWWEPLDERQPLRSLARKILSHSSNGPIERRVARVMHDVQRFNVDGVIHWGHWGCRQSTGALRVVADRLKQAGVPLLQLDGDCIEPANTPTGQLRTRLEAFVETLT
jgi:benzoyl-CoA reductase/2-hydroxyglutaryl-CoA dehydratase subunit BcrC/BadD/HgdB